MTGLWKSRENSFFLHFLISRWNYSAVWSKLWYMRLSRQLNGLWSLWTSESKAICWPQIEHRSQCHRLNVAVVNRHRTCLQLMAFSDRNSVDWSSVTDATDAITEIQLLNSIGVRSASCCESCGLVERHRTPCQSTNFIAWRMVSRRMTREVEARSTRRVERRRDKS